VGLWTAALLVPMQALVLALALMQALRAAPAAQH
jgi:hypothetical protein